MRQVFTQPGERLFFLTDINEKLSQRLGGLQQYNPKSQLKSQCFVMYQVFKKLIHVKPQKLNQKLV